MFRFVLIALMGLSLSACATVVRGTSEDWVAESEPSGARVETTNGYSCPSTPCAIDMPRRSTFVATFSKDGYESVEVHVSNEIAGRGAAGLAGNVLIGGVIGIGVDAVSGAALDLTPNPARVTMRELGEGEENTPAVMHYERSAPEEEAEEEPEDDVLMN